jgi:hypothetical protein
MVSLPLLLNLDEAVYFDNNLQWPSITAEAIEDLQLATELIDEGNKTWPNVPFTEKGSSFKTTLRRLVTVQAMREWPLQDLART